MNKKKLLKVLERMEPDIVIMKVDGEKKYFKNSIEVKNPVGLTGVSGLVIESESRTGRKRNQGNKRTMG